MTKLLDRDQPYGEVFGAANGARYEQGGRQFSAAGVELSKAPSPAAARPVGRPPGKGKPPAVNTEADALSPEQQILSQLGVS